MTVATHFFRLLGSSSRATLALAVVSTGLLYVVTATPVTPAKADESQDSLTAAQEAIRDARDQLQRNKAPEKLQPQPVKPPLTTEREHEPIKKEITSERGTK